MVAISYGKGVIECHAYDNLDTRSFASFVNGKFDSICLQEQTRMVLACLYKSTHRTRILLLLEEYLK